MQLIVKIIDKINDAVLLFCGFLCFALILLTCQQVVARYYFDAGSIALHELQWHLFGVIFLLAAGAALRYKTHVRVDVFYSRYPPAMQKVVDNLGIILFLLPSMAVLVFYGWHFAFEARVYMSPRALDHLSSQWLSDSSRMYPLASSVENWLRSWLLVGEVSSSPSGLEARWLIKLMIPIGAALLFLQGIAEILRSFFTTDQKQNLNTISKNLRKRSEASS